MTNSSWFGKWQGNRENLMPNWSSQVDVNSLTAILIVDICLWTGTRIMGAAAVFGGNNSKLNVEQWRCVNTLRGHSGGESLVKGQRSKVLTFVYWHYFSFTIVSCARLMPVHLYMCATTSCKLRTMHLCTGVHLEKINPLTLRSDLHITSPYNIHPLSIKQVMRILKCIR